MSHVTKESTAQAIRTRLELLRNYHYAAVRSGEERLQAAMADYLQSWQYGGEHEAA